VHCYLNWFFVFIISGVYVNQKHTILFPQLLDYCAGVRIGIPAYFAHSNWQDRLLQRATAIKGVQSENLMPVELLPATSFRRHRLAKRNYLLGINAGGGNAQKHNLNPPLGAIPRTTRGKLAKFFCAKKNYDVIFLWNPKSFSITKKIADGFNILRIFWEAYPKLNTLLNIIKNCPLLFTIVYYNLQHTLEFLF